LLIIWVLLQASTSFLDIKENDLIRSFLDSKLKSREDDPDKKSIVTWNDYLGRIKYFMRWLYNCRTRDSKENDLLRDPVYWKTPSFIQIRKKKTKRLSPYSETEIWDREEVLCIVKYERYKRNKSALTLLWDLDARNHEVTLLKIKHIRLRERYLFLLLFLLFQHFRFQIHVLEHLTNTMPLERSPEIM
jgi:integrase/recombinase XerD